MPLVQKERPYRTCRSKRQQNPPSRQGSSYRNKSNLKKTHRAQGDEPSSGTEESSSDEYTLHKVGEHASDPVEVQVLVNGKQLDMEVDTSAALSIMSESTRKSVFPHEKL